MGCPSKCYIGEDLVFSVRTHGLDGIIADADAAPTYKIYDDAASGVALASGSMAKRDDANTVGFYIKKVTISGGNGFVSGKSYTVYIDATVGGDDGGVSYVFKAETPILSLVIDGTATLGVAMKKILAYCSGKLIRQGLVYTYRNFDDTADEMILTVASITGGHSRTRS